MAKIKGKTIALNENNSKENLFEHLYLDRGKDHVDILYKGRKQLYLNVEPEEITGEMVLKLIKHHEAIEVPRLKILDEYYQGKTAITKRVVKDKKKPNNKVATGYSAYIVDTTTGYFIGKPVSYSMAGEEELYEQLMKDVQDVLDYNDEQDENSEIARMAGGLGWGYEIVYRDKDSELRFNEVSPMNMVMIYNTEINPEPIGAIYYIDNLTIDDLLNESITKNNKEIGNKLVTLYTPTKEKYFEIKDGEIKEREVRATEWTEDNKAVETYVTEKIHGFSQVPVIQFINNDYLMADFEREIPLIDIAEKSLSDTANDNESFTNAILALTDMEDTEKENIEEVKEEGVILIPKGGEAKFITKQVNDKALKDYNELVNQLIHKFSGVPDMSDENFAGNSSGVAMEYKLWTTDQKIAVKERKFKRALLRRIELIIEGLIQENPDYKNMEDEIRKAWLKIGVQFTRNKPIDLKSEADTLNILKDFISKKKVLQLASFIDDVNEEIIQQEEEAGAYNTEYDEAYSEATEQANMIFSYLVNSKEFIELYKGLDEDSELYNVLPADVKNELNSKIGLGGNVDEEGEDNKVKE